MALSEDQSVKLAMGEPPRMDVDTSSDDRQALLTAIAHAQGPQRLALQTAYDRTYGGAGAGPPIVARAMRDGFPETRGNTSAANDFGAEPPPAPKPAYTPLRALSLDDVEKGPAAGRAPGSGLVRPLSLEDIDGPPKKGVLQDMADIARDPEGGYLAAAGRGVSHLLGGDSAPSTSGGVAATAADVGRKAIVGLNDLGESAVGLISLATGGVFGEQMAKLGYDPKAGDALISSYNSVAQQQADQNVAEAQGFLGKLAALAVEPRAVLGQVVEMLPGLAAMGAGGAAAAGRAVRATMPAALDAAAAAGLEGKAAEQFIAKFITEKAKAQAAAQLGTSAVFGGQTAGTIAEQGRASGQDYSTYAPAALVAGLATVATAYGSKAAASAMGVGDVSTDLATRMAGAGASRTAGGTLASAGKEAVKGGLENAAFSGISGVGTNVATGQDPLANDLGGQIGQGAAVGALVSGAHGALAGKPARPGEPAPVAETQHPLTEAMDGYLRAGDSAQVAKDIAGAPTVEAAIDAAHAHSQTASALLDAAATTARDVRAEAGRQAAARAAIDALTTAPGEPPKVPEAPISAPAAGRIDSSQYADLTPMDRRTAEGRLRAMQDMAPATGEGTGLNVVDHPDGTGRYAIARVGSTPDAERAGPATKDVGSTSVIPETNAPAAPAEPPKTRQVVSALKLPPHERSAVENARIQAAERHYSPEDMAVIRKAAGQPFAMTAAERVRFSDLKSSESRNETTTEPPLTPEEIAHISGAVHAGLTGKDAPAAPVATARPQENVRTEEPSLPRQSEAKAGELSQETHHVIVQMARMLGKKVVVQGLGNNDGQVSPRTDPNTIYLNRTSSKPHLVVFGHEIYHLMKVEHPEAAKVLADAMGLKDDANLDVPGIRGDHEEVQSDLHGNRFAEPQFWVDTFRKVLETDGAPATMHLGATIAKTIRKMTRALGGIKGYDTDSMVKDLGAVRDAASTALSQYIRSRKGAAQELDRQSNSEFQNRESPGAVDTKASEHRLSPAQREELSSRDDAGESLLKGLTIKGNALSGDREALVRLAKNLRSDYGPDGLETGSAAKRRTMLALADAIDDTGTKFSESRGKLDPEDRLTKARGKDGTEYDVVLHREMLGDKLHSVYVKAEDAKGTASWVDFVVKADGTLSAGMVKSERPGNGTAEMLYRAARAAGYDISPGMVQTAQGEGLVARLKEKGLINREDAGLNKFHKSLGDQIRTNVEYGQMLARRHEWKHNVGDTLLSTKTGRTYTITGRSFQRVGRLKDNDWQPVYRYESSKGDEQGSFEERRLTDSKTMKNLTTPQELKGSEKRNDDGIDVEGIHYSQQPRKVLSTAFAGSGYAGAERERDAAKNRLAFYVDKGQGIRPESGVGPYAHKAMLRNLYDAGNDPGYLKEDAKDDNDFEQRVQDAGYNGYYAPDFTTRQGAAVLLGQHEVPVEQVGQGARPPNGREVLRRAREDVGYRADIAALRADPDLPAGQGTGERWQARLEVSHPEIAAEMARLGVFARIGDEPVYKDGLIRAYKDAAKTAEPKGTALLNVGLDVSDENGGGKLTPDEVRAALKDRGREVLEHQIHQSETEPTMVARIDKPLDQPSLHSLSRRLRQDAIAQRADDGTGMLEGPKAAAWGGKYVPDYFRRMDGRTDTEHGAPEVRASAKREELNPDVVATLGKHIRNLLPDERARLRRDTAEKFVRIISSLPSANEMAAVSYAGRAKRGWYAHSAAAMEHVFGADAPRFAALLAALSPQTGVEDNLRNALHVWRAWVKEGRPTTPEEINDILGKNVQGDKGDKSVLDAWRNNSIRALTREDGAPMKLSGPKVNSFFKNLIGHVEEVTNDTWMANFALVSQKIFAGTAAMDALTGEKLGQKSPGYMAMSAQVRAAAKVLTRLTGEEWTPAEVQETIWSWAKTLYERANVDESAVDLVKNKALTDELINSTPDFRTLFHADTNERILRDAGYGDRLDSLRDRSDLEFPGDQERGAEGETAPFAEDTQQRYEVAAARRLDALRARGREPADDVVASEKREPSDEELGGRKVTYPVHVEETGETAHVTVDAREELAAYKERESVMQRLAECLAR